MNIPIQPRIVNPTFTFHTCRILSMSVTPYQNAKIMVELYFTDSTGTIPNELCTVRRTLEMTTEEYNLWTNDDYLISYVKTKLNLQ